MLTLTPDPLLGDEGQGCAAVLPNNGCLCLLSCFSLTVHLRNLSDSSLLPFSPFLSPPLLWIGWMGAKPNVPSFSH